MFLLDCNPQATSVELLANGGWGWGGGKRGGNAGFCDSYGFSVHPLIRDVILNHWPTNLYFDSRHVQG